MRFLIAVVCLLPMIASAQSFGGLKDLSSNVLDGLSSTVSGSMSDVLQSQLGITEDQFAGGVGSMLSLASEKLSAGEFDKIASLIPGADKYLATAKSLGVVASPLLDMSDPDGALSSLGLSQDTISKFVPSVTDYLGNLGSEETSALLQQVFGS